MGEIIVTSVPMSLISCHLYVCLALVSAINIAVHQNTCFLVLPEVFVLSTEAVPSPRLNPEQCCF